MEESASLKMETNGDVTRKMKNQDALALKTNTMKTEEDTKEEEDVSPNSSDSEDSYSDPPTPTKTQASKSPKGEASTNKIATPKKDCGAEIPPVRTRLHEAADGGLLREMEEELKEGADLEGKDRLWRTPLLRAALSNQPSAIAFLHERGANMSAVDEHGWNALHAATVKWTPGRGHVEAAKKLLELGVNLEAVCKKGRTPLLLAARRGYEQLLLLFKAEGANLEALDKFRRTALHLAAYGGHAHLLRMLRDWGTSVNAGDTWDRTPLHYAAEKNKEDVLQALLDLGADINARDDWRRTPLHLAYRLCSRKTIRALEAKGADMAAVEKWGKTPAEMAPPQFNIDEYN